MSKLRNSRPAVILSIFTIVILSGYSNFAVAEQPENAVGKRPPWTTSTITGSPEPPLPYVSEQVFPSLQFNQSLDITRAPGTDRLFVLEQSGKIYSFRPGPAVKKADLVFDIKKTVPGVVSVYALTFHPDFATNGYFYICYIMEGNVEDGTHIARFQLKNLESPSVDAASEQTIITWYSGGHNGCCLKFGPDGYLYISTGDGAPPNPPDTMKTGQDITDLLSSILRIDVDHPESGRNYRIPRDNPFVDMKDARGEVWAYGFRNPWRMSFDRKTGDLWVGDVGWELWELLVCVERGGNYGWGVMEGRQSINPEWPRGPTPILPPTIDHSHAESSSVTEGLTYYGERLEELKGNHIYGDFDTGKFWGFRFENGKVVDHREIADTTLRVVGFCETHDGEFYFLDYSKGTLHRLVKNPRKNLAITFPRKLSESGLFSSVSQQVPAPGVLPYSINAEPWADHSVAERFVAVPQNLTVAVGSPSWEFPKDSVLVKTISLDMEVGNPATRRRLETQLLHFDGAEWFPYTYIWNQEQSDAELLAAAGMEQTFQITDASTPGGKRNQKWRFSGRAECQRCHNKWSGPPLSFNTPQLNREHFRKDISVSQLDVFARSGLLANPAPEANSTRLADPYDGAADRDGRARAYLQVNCAHCHRLHAGSTVLSKMHFDLPLDKTNMVNVRPTQGTFGIQAAKVIAPGDPFRSVLLYRMSKLGGGRMPHIGSNEVDLAGSKLIYEWIRQLPCSPEQDKEADRVAARIRRDESETLAQLGKAKAGEDQTKLVRRLLSSTSGALMLLKSLDDGGLPDPVKSRALAAATRHEDVRIRDLYERFLPAEQRVQRLGSVVQSEQILKLHGDASRGKTLLLNTAGVQCINCHRIGKQGKDVGPELTLIGKKYSKVQLLESMLEPSKFIDPKYVTYLVETVNGQLFTGLLVKKGEKEIVLKDAKNELVRIATDEVEQLVSQHKSLMPDLLLRDMTAQQVADLLVYLSSLK